MSPMSRSIAGLAVALLLAAPIRGGAAAPSVLFIGNSFTFGSGSAVHLYRADTVTDLNGQGKGGIPALFRAFANQAGLDFDVSLETQPGSGLEFHLENKRAELTRRPWDTVVMHGQSTLDFAKPGDPTKLIETSAGMAALLRGKNPKVAIYLLATWSRADQTYPAEGAWAGKPIEAMARDVRAAYDQAAARIQARGVLPVGEAWTRAMQSGVADPNPYDGIAAGTVDLWAWDHYHASVAGSYLEALVVFGALTGRDPRSLGEFECTAYELGLSRAQATALQRVAHDQLAASAIAMAPGGAPRIAAARCQAPPKAARVAL